MSPRSPRTAPKSPRTTAHSPRANLNHIPRAPRSPRTTPRTPRRMVGHIRRDKRDQFWRKFMRVPVYSLMTVFWCSLQAVAFKRVGYSLENYPIFVLLVVSASFVPIFFAVVYFVEQVYGRRYDWLKAKELENRNSANNSTTVSRNNTAANNNSAGLLRTESEQTENINASNQQIIVSEDNILEQNLDDAAKSSAVNPLSPFVLKSFGVLGVLSALNGLFTLFANPYVGGIEQSVLAQGNIPFTMFMSIRFLQADYSKRQYLGALVILAGIFIGICFNTTNDGSGNAQNIISNEEENMRAGMNAGGDSLQKSYEYSDNFNYTNNKSENTDSSSSAQTIPFFAFLFFLGTVPAAFMSVYQEKCFADKKVNVVHMMAYSNLFQFIAMIFLVGPMHSLMPLFIPNSNAAEKEQYEEESLFANLHNGLRCFADTSGTYIGESCKSAQFDVFLCIITMLLSTVFQTLLVRFSSATWSVLISTLITPASAICFTFPSLMGVNHTESLDAGLSSSLCVLLVGIFLFRYEDGKTIDDINVSVVKHERAIAEAELDECFSPPRTPVANSPRSPEDLKSGNNLLTVPIADRFGKVKVPQISKTESLENKKENASKERSLNNLKSLLSASTGDKTDKTPGLEDNLNIKDNSPIDTEAGNFSLPDSVILVEEKEKIKELTERKKRPVLLNSRCGIVPSEYTGNGFKGVFNSEKRNEIDILFEWTTPVSKRTRSHQNTSMPNFSRITNNIASAQQNGNPGNANMPTVPSGGLLDILRASAEASQKNTTNTENYTEGNINILSRSRSDPPFGGSRSVNGNGENKLKPLQVPLLSDDRLLNASPDVVES